MLDSVGFSFLEIWCVVNTNIVAISEDICETIHSQVTGGTPTLLSIWACVYTKPCMYRKCGGAYAVAKVLPCEQAFV